jgi:hypothetical protein
MDKDKIIITKKFQLDKVRERQKKQLKKKAAKTYYAPTGTEILANMVEYQNKELLDRIVEYKEMPDEDAQNLFRLFWNPSYWIPKPTVDDNK